MAADAAALFNCANPLYYRWSVDWPPMAQAMLAAAERTGAVLAIASNLYGYGDVFGAGVCSVDKPMTPDLPLTADFTKAQVPRADVARSRWPRTRLVGFARWRCGERITSVPASSRSWIGCCLPCSRVRRRGLWAILTSLTRGPTPATWRARSWRPPTPEAAWGRPWHALVASDDSQRQALTRAAELAGVPTRRSPHSPCGRCDWRAGSTRWSPNCLRSPTRWLALRQRRFRDPRRT